MAGKDRTSLEKLIQAHNKAYSISLVALNLIAKYKLCPTAVLCVCDCFFLVIFKYINSMFVAWFFFGLNILFYCIKFVIDELFFGLYFSNFFFCIVCCYRLTVLDRMYSYDKLYCFWTLGSVSFFSLLCCDRKIPNKVDLLILLDMFFCLLVVLFN